MARQNTKEELMQQVVSLENEVKSLREDLQAKDANDRNRRANFTGILTGHRSHSMLKMWNEPDENPMTWMTIASEIGKLLAAKTFITFDEDVAMMKERLDNMEKQSRRNMDREEGGPCQERGC